MKSPRMHSDAEKEKTDMVLMLRGMRAPCMRKALRRPVTRVTKKDSSRFQLYSKGDCVEGIVNFQGCLTEVSR